MKKAVYPGSFDPITLGHIDIIRRIHSHFDELVILVAQSSQKNSLFTAEERMQMIRDSLPEISNLEVATSSGLTVDYMREQGAKVIIRGLRAVTDFEYEMSMASMNQKIAPDIETMLIFARPEFYYISSRGVKEVAANAGPLDGLVSETVQSALLKKYNKSKGV